MKSLIALTALAGGLLLILVPRFILPACEYTGTPPMHCSDTARAEYVVGALLMALGAALFFFKSAKAAMAAGGAAAIFYGVAFWLPDKFGYCRSPQMSCNYGMVPGIRFISVIAGLILAFAVFNLARTMQRKGKS